MSTTTNNAASFIFHIEIKNETLIAFVYTPNWSARFQKILQFYWLAWTCGRVNWDLVSAKFCWRECSIIGYNITGTGAALQEQCDSLKPSSVMNIVINAGTDRQRSHATLTMSDRLHLLLWDWQRWRSCLLHWDIQWFRSSLLHLDWQRCVSMLRQRSCLYWNWQRLRSCLPHWDRQTLRSCPFTGTDRDLGLVSLTGTERVRGHAPLLGLTKT